MNIENIANEIQKWVESESCNACEHCSDSIVVGSDALVNFIAELFAKEQKKLEGCVVVPVEPTEAMMISGAFSFVGRVPNDLVYPNVRKVWTAMVEAARGGR